MRIQTTSRDLVGMIVSIYVYRPCVSRAIVIRNSLHEGSKSNARSCGDLIRSKPEWISPHGNHSI
jgi:hypothetical protein